MNTTPTRPLRVPASIKVFQIESSKQAAFRINVPDRPGLNLRLCFRAHLRFNERMITIAKDSKFADLLLLGVGSSLFIKRNYKEVRRQLVGTESRQVSSIM